MFWGVGMQVQVLKVGVMVVVFEAFAPFPPSRRGGDRGVYDLIVPQPLLPAPMWTFSCCCISCWLRSRSTSSRVFFLRTDKVCWWEDVGSAAFCVAILNWNPSGAF